MSRFLTILMLAAMELGVGASGGAFAQTATLPDPLGPASAGRVQCYTPDLARKTCQSIALYGRGADGRIINTAVVLIAPNPVIVMETASPVEVRDGAVCGAIHAADLETAKYTVGGQALEGEAAEPLRKQIRQALAPMFEREVCTRYAPDGDGLKATATIDGVAQPALTQKVIWVSPADGWQVAP